MYVLLPFFQPLSVVPCKYNSAILSLVQVIIANCSNNTFPSFAVLYDKKLRYSNDEVLHNSHRYTFLAQVISTYR